MKHFSLGLAAGAACGMLLSLLTDADGKRVGAPIKHEINHAKEDTNELLTAATNLKVAKQQLTSAVPQAQQAIIGLQNDITYYQKKLVRLIKDLKDQSDELNTDLASKKSK